MDKRHTMTGTELIEAIDLIIDYMLCDPAYCGSLEGRRLQQIQRGFARPRKEAVASGTETRNLVNRNVVLPIELDNAVTVEAEKYGITRNRLIEIAIHELVSRGRP